MPVSPAMTMVLQNLVKTGKYKLAFRVILNHHRLLNLQRAKEKHNRKANKLTKKTIELHYEIAVVNFNQDLDVLTVQELLEK